MIPIRTRYLVAALAVPSLLLTACGSDSDAGSGSESESVAAVIKGLDNPFFQAMRDGLTDEADADGISVEVQAAQDISDTTGQAERLTALAQQDFGCFVVNPISGNNLVQGLAGIDVPVVNIDQPLDSDAAEAAGVEAATYIGTDNVSAGELAGEHMVELVGSGSIGMIGGIAGNITSEDRLTGFENAAGDTLDLLPVVSADWNRQQALTAATDLMTANPDLVGIFAANDDMALGAARAVANAGKTDEIAVIGLDGNEEALQAVADGTLDATVAQYPYAIGQLGMQACEALVAGDDVPESIEAPVALVTPDVAEEALSAFPAPFEEFDNPLD
ncbi:substrate-binding domain-containing protein [Nocardioides bruguierae]|uniref:substrate-binding domain-containing protein n=1 Tax=Nocardioides bruguierae TaxID=2945102 RepID=UPI002020CFC1|nr:substrate-binding domain-containing protein [Nocardioides bruguierae]MCL8025579.1 substrate-binding domain-containing protein [Nocardioides bruguierae]